MRKVNNFFKIPMNKPNMGIVIFQGIQIASHHIPKNLDARGNMNPPYQTPLKCKCNF